MRTVDDFMAVPSLLIALFVLFLIGGGLLNMFIIFTLVRWVVYARLARGITLTCRQSSFVESALSIGALCVNLQFLCVNLQSDSSSLR